ncbi:MAG TPA: small multi-drug export protein [Candidatus Stackebrandtia excrementipullorum]|nr:small multi-drug export protein [Candidatus Stackebrandtia excrementipullorum]
MKTLLAYLGVVLAAATPWVELFAIPPSIVLGLSPVVVGLVAFVGNAAVTLGVVFGWERLSAWWRRKRGRPLGIDPARSSRSRRAFDRYGVPGLALQGPILSGMYLAALLALSLGADRRRVLFWSLVSIALWSSSLVVATVAGVGLFG